MTQAELDALIQAIEDNRTRKIKEIVEKSKTIEEAVAKIEALLVR
jgi:uncharacterized protein YdbL (DUF1318 family)